MSQTPHSLEYTKILTDVVFHYTCNAPTQSKLDKYGISAKGEEFGCRDPREVLLIPIKVYQRFGYSVTHTSIQATSEHLLRTIDKKR